MKKLKGFIHYYGGKNRLSPKYSKPKHDMIIEPFAGSAGYSLRYYHRQVILVEKDVKVVSMWDYLINAKESEILSLPIVVDHLDNTRLCEEAKHLIGFWFNDGSAQPKKSPSGRNYWSESVRNRIASQLKYIRHWCIIYGDYSDAPDVEATWFIDPPYQGQGKYYKHSSNDIDFDSLSNWVLNLQGQVIVCENHGADWLPFEFLEEINGGLNVDGRSKKSKEAVFEIDL